jgi:hypothetical protein
VTEKGKIEFNLDSPDSRARTLDDHNNPTRQHFFDEKQVNLNRDEPSAFSASVVTANCDCDFVFDVHFPNGQTQVIDDSGKPWTISAIAPNYRASYQFHIYTPADEARGVPPPSSGTLIIPCAWPTGCRAGAV